MEDDESRLTGDATNPPTQELRINIPTAASVAGISEPDATTQMSTTSEPAPTKTPRIVGRSLQERIAAARSSDNLLEEIGPEAEPTTGSYPLPDWSDPPTGLVPKVLLDDCDTEGIEGDFIEPGLRGPSWREGGSDWDSAADLTFLMETETDADETSAIAGQIEVTERPFQSGFDEINIVLGSAPRRDDVVADVTRDDPLEAWASSGAGLTADGNRTADAGDGTPRPHRRSHRRTHEKVASAAVPRNAVIATVVGIAIGAIALACFALGALASLVLITIVVTVAAAELFSSLQRTGYRPATLLGLVAVPAMIIGTYLRGPIAIPFVIALLMVGSAFWGIAGLTGDAPVVNLGVTALVVSWTGILGSFAGLLLNPTTFPDRNGVAFVVGAVALTVAHDVGSYVAGSFFGRHPIAPRISPGKTREGLAGGSLLALVVALGIVARIHPFDLSRAVELWVLVLIFAPLGDLFESVVKRDLGLKDMGKILPAHGGVFDRIDAMLFVLPACYLLVRALGLV